MILMVCKFKIAKATYREPVRYSTELHRERAAYVICAGVNNTLTVRYVHTRYRPHALIACGSYSCTLILQER